MRRGVAIVGCGLLIAVAIGGCRNVKITTHEITIAPDQPVSGQEVDFSAQMRTSQTVGLWQVDFQWDLDGDGRFETSSSPALVEGSQFQRDYTTRISRSYPAAQTVRIGSLTNVADDAWLGLLIGGDTSYENATLTVSDPGPTPEPAPSVGEPQPNQPPLASFTADPNPAEPHEMVRFDASGSSDPDGSIVRYEWDLDRVDDYERDTGTDPTTSTFFDSPGTYAIRLRVTDDDGATATTSRDVIVRFDPRTGRVAHRAPKLPGFELRPNGRDVNEGVFMVNGDELILSRAKARGTFSPEPFPKRLHGSRDVRWAADYVVTTDTESGSGDAEAFVLLAFATGGRACLGVTVTGVGTDDPQGSFRVLGAIGKASRLRGAGTAIGATDDGRPVVKGRGRFRLGEEQDFGLGASRCGKLRRLAPQRD